jgi:hypothetical protein
MTQLSNTQPYITKAGYNELRLNSISSNREITLILHLRVTKCSLSAAGVVCVHSVQCAEGVGWIDNSVIPTSLSYLIDTATTRNV